MNNSDVKICFGADEPGLNLEKFYRDVVKINREFTAIEDNHRALTADYEGCKSETTKLASEMKAQGSRMGQKAAHEDCSKTAHNAGVVKALWSKMNHKADSKDCKSKTIDNASLVQELRFKMDYDVGQTLKRAKRLKGRLTALVKSNEESRSQPNCGPSSLSDRTRTPAVGVLEKNLIDKMEGFQKLRGKINEEYKVTIQSRYFTVTEEYPDEQTVDLLISTGETETFFQMAIQQQGKEQILDTLAEVQEWQAVVKDMERNLKELDQIFRDTVVLVQHQGEQSDDIEAQVHGATSHL